MSEPLEKLEVFVKEQKKHWQRLVKGKVPELQIVKSWIEACDFALEDVQIIQHQKEVRRKTRGLL